MDGGKSDQLEEHSIERTRFEKLSDLVGIVPSDFTFEWVKFMRECMKRGNQPSQEAVSQIFELVDDEDIDHDVLVELICEFSEYCP